MFESREILVDWEKLDTKWLHCYFGASWEDPNKYGVPVRCGGSFFLQFEIARGNIDLQPSEGDELVRHDQHMVILNGVATSTALIAEAGTLAKKMINYWWNL